ncbi:maguk P55 subfamily member 2,6, putative [Schistosoma mansoni]|uniref:maguk P55 subfamily member 2,6, putative n=1 Tax=Schistosoma mansoni TaxID=6183 RepID=UPI00022C870F|nr:maguk P55 subfamily member 2,6, putative [Schistosoma mansoni]|eukprot:XP_018647055.1 maguk P55 subfamily member 2,6, putative [Schistosoma mansoni]
MHNLHKSRKSILQVFKQEDPYWWQARHHNQDGRAGLIPSIVLQERRKAFIQSAPNPEELTYKTFACGLARRRKKKVTIPFCARDADNYDTKDIVLYEEVAMVSGFQRPVICLIGAPGVGRRSLRNMLIRANRERYASAIAYTSKELDVGEEDDGEFINPNTNSQKLNIENYVDQLRDHMSKLKPINTREQSRAVYIPKDLSNCTHVWIRCDKIKAPLSPPFEGPFKVVSRKAKYFVIEKHGNIDTVSIDRLKPAYLDHEPPYVLLDRLTDKSITESKCKDDKSLQMTKTARWAHPISQSRMLTVSTAG